MLKRTTFLSLVAALALPGAAAASTTVTHDGSRTLIAGDADADAVSVDYTYFGTAPISGDGVRITNPQGVVPGPGCVPESPTAAACPVGPEGLDAELGDGGDAFEFADSEFVDVRTDVAGQGGADTLTGTFFGSLDGGDGDDALRPIGYGDQQVTGGGGTDTVELSGYEGYVTIGAGESEYGTRVAPDVERLRGGAGDDYFYVASGAGGGHAIEGGPGYDLLSYGSADAPVTVNVGGTGTDVVAGDVESVIGSAGDDVLNGNGVARSLSGGGGSDRISGGDGPDTMSGGDGDDTLLAAGGNDRLNGGDGNDRLEAGPGEDALSGGEGADVLRGGADKDSVSYADPDDFPYEDEYYTEFAAEPRDHESTDPDAPRPGVTISLDDRANDGRASEGDDVGSDVELVTGSGGDDTITGGPGDNEIAGGAGRDRIDGGDGADKVHGGLGDDVVTGGSGNDEVRGGSDNDQLDGGPGEDLVIGQEEEDSVDGIDLVEVRDGERDAVACPAGLSRVLADQHDLVDGKCALIERFTVGPPGAPPPPPVGPSPLLRVHLKGTVVDRRGIARIRATCAPAPVPCAGRMSLFTLHERKLRRLGRTVFAVPAAKTRIVRVKLSKLGRRLVRTRRAVRTQIFVAHQSPDAKPVRIATVALRKARRR